MHGDTALNGCECMVSESTLCLGFDGVLGALGQCPAESHGFINGKENMCRVLASRGRSSPSPRAKDPQIMVIHSPQQ